MIAMGYSKWHQDLYKLLDVINIPRVDWVLCTVYKCFKCFHNASGLAI